MEFNRCMGCMEKLTSDLDVCPQCGYKKGTPPNEIYYLEPETILAGRYIIGKSLGAGGFGITYIAWDLAMERKVAIKEYLPKDFATRFQGQTVVSVYGGELTEQFDAGLHSFVDEAKRLAKFYSTNGIVHIFDSFIENSTAYIIMEFLDGESLKDLAVREGKIPYDQAVRYIIPVLRELEKVHSEGIIHRDIAPDNIMLTKDGKVKLIDFGAAKHATTLHSKSMSVVLKPGYSPEEQYRSRGNQGPWTDIYAISATLYRLITGKVPVDAQERKNSTEPKNILKKPSELGINIPENIEIAIMNGMNIYAENRYQTAKEFADVLENLVPAERIEEKPSAPPAPTFNWKVIAAMLGGIGVAVAILIVLLSTGTLQKITAERLPNVIEMSVEQAAEALEPYGYIYSTDETDAENKIRIEDTIYDLAIPENMILSQSPNAGSKIDTDKYPDVYLVLSAGAREVYLPEMSFVGMEQAEVVAQLEALGLVVNIIEAESDEFAKGYVSAQEYAPETRLKEGDSITITVSSGSASDRKEATTVPDVVGFVQEKAQQTIADFLLFTAIEEAYSDTVPEGTVISQAPVAGSDAVTNETIVTIVISKGAKTDETTRVPNVTNRKQNNAVNLLKAADLNYKVEYAYSNNIAQGTVISQSIKADTKVKVGTTVTITVSKGAKNDSASQKEQATNRTTTTTTSKPTTITDSRITLPNVVGLTEVNAKSKLSNCSVSVTYGYCDSVAKGKVIKQSPSSGTKVNSGSTVTLIVSMGAQESNFSAWSTTKPTGNVIVEQKNQYRSRTITKENVYSDWVTQKSTSTKPTESDTLRITGTWTQYHYYHYCNYYYNGGNNWNVDSIPYGSQSHRHDTYLNQKLPEISFQDQGNKQAYGGTGASVTSACEYDFYIWFYAGQTTFYNYQTRSITGTKNVYSDWSSWGDAYKQSNSSLQVESRTVYRSCPNYKTYDAKGNIIS